VHSLCSVRVCSPGKLLDNDCKKQIPVHIQKKNSLSVSLSDTLDLILLLDSEGVGGTLGGIDELISEALSNGLYGPESGLTSTLGEEPDSLVHTAKGGHIYSLSAYNTSGSDTSGVFTGTTVDNSVYDYLDGVGISEKVDDLKGVLKDADSHKLLAVVAAGPHEGVGKPLNNGALSLPKPLLVEAAGGMGQENSRLGLDGDVISQAQVADLDVLEGPEHP